MMRPSGRKNCPGNKTKTLQLSMEEWKYSSILVYVYSSFL
jgi:hypothetical protein